MATKIEELTAILKGAPGEVFIQPHDVPDPDAIASAFGLQELLGRHGVGSRIVYGREYEKTDARKMVDSLGIELSLAPEAASPGTVDWVVIVDGQKGNANIVKLDCARVAVIDHHADLGDPSYRFSDIRPGVGSCSAIVADYFFEAGLEPSRLVATALTYGIFIDTDYLTRGVSDLDAAMFHRLRAYADAELIRRLRGSQITLEDLHAYAEAFRTAEIYGRLGFLSLPDAEDSLVGAANDIALSIDEVEVSVAFSERADGVKLSVRSLLEEIGADELAKSIVAGLGFGGGHRHMAGGFIPAGALPSGKSVSTTIKHRAISFLEARGL